MNRPSRSRARRGRTLGLALFVGLLFTPEAKAESTATCFFQKGPRIAEISTRLGRHVELFDGQIAIDGVWDDACHALPGSDPTAITPYRDGFAIAFRDGPVAYWADGRYTPLDGAPKGLVRALSSHGDALFIGTESGLVEWRAPGVVTPVLSRELDGAAVSALATESDGTTLVGTDEKGLWAVSSDGARALQRRRGLAVGCFRRQGTKVVPEPPGSSCGGAVLAGTLPSSHVTALVVHEDRVTAGSFDRGVFTVDARGNATSLAGAPLHVNALASGGASLYVGATNGFFVAAHGEPAVRVSLGAPEPHVNDLSVGRGGAVWLATNRGLFSWSNGAVARADDDVLPSSLVYAVTEASDGTVWAGTAKGLYQSRPGGGRVFSTANGKLPHDWVTAVFADGSAIYAGTYNAGIVRIDPGGRTDSVRSFESAWINPHGLSRVDGVLYAATAGGGLLSESAAVPARLPSPDVTAVLEHKGALWVGTESGLLVWRTVNSRGSPL